MFNINHFGEEPEDDNNKVEIPDEYKSQIDTLYDDYGFISEKDFDEDGKKISTRAIKYIKSLLDNDMYSFLVEQLPIIKDGLDITNSQMFKYKFKDLLYDIMDYYKQEDLIDENDNIQYSYSDKRQQELFSDEDFKFDPSFAEHCKH